MLSEEQKELEAKMDSIADEYMKINIPNATAYEFENLAIAFSYIQTAKLVKISENLVRSTKKLNCLTITLIVITAILAILAGIQIFRCI